LLKRAQAVVQKTSRKNVTSTVLIFFFFSVFLMDVMGGKITITLKEKEETHAHRKRARSALSRKRTLRVATVMHHKSGVLGPTGQGS
jgi:Na+-transporting methylmalonyl-CoA/oxaloacetate decarboxylase gamma subunit